MSDSADRTDWVLTLDEAVGDDLAASALQIIKERLSEPSPFLLADISRATRLDGGHLAVMLAASKAAPRRFAVVVSDEVATSLREWRVDAHIRTFDQIEVALATLDEEARA